MRVQVPGRRLWRSSIVAAMAMTAGSLAMPATAQVGDPDLGERVWRELSNCGNCHGWAGDGIPNVAQESGADLRNSLLTPEFAVDVVRCGRPGTAMPSFLRNAWTERNPCYGQTAPLAGGLQPEEAENALSDRWIQAVVAFIFRDFIGQGPVTKEYCQSVFSEDNPRCDGYPSEADLAADLEPAEEPEPVGHDD